MSGGLTASSHRFKDKLPFFKNKVNPEGFLFFTHLFQRLHFPLLTKRRAALPHLSLFNLVNFITVDQMRPTAVRVSIVISIEMRFRLFAISTEAQEPMVTP